MIKKLAILLFLLPLKVIYSQNYIEIFKISYANTGIGYEDNSHNSSLNSLDASLLIPIPINDKTAFLTGVDFNLRNLELFPKSDATTLYNTVFKLGISSTFNEKLSGYVILLPKFASDYESNFGSSFLIGGIGMLKFKKNDNLTYKLGFYASQEAYGFFGTPILGLFYLSSNQKLSLDLSLPLLGEANYSLGKKTSVGLDFQAVRRSFIWENTIM